MGWTFLPSCAADDKPHPNKKDVKQTPFLEIRLHDLGYQPEPEYRYPGTGVPRDLSILNEDSKKRLAFVSDKVLAVYFSHLPALPNNKGLATDSLSMEAFFVDPNLGSLISRKTWATRKRKWLNERWDTQARILPVREGFLVHAGNSMILYSTDQQEKAKISLDDQFLWAATVPPLGRTVHLQQIEDDNNAEGEWLASDTLHKIATQRESAGVTSASDNAVVTELAHCVQLQSVGESPRDLCCHDPCRLGLPEFLSSTEILNVYPNGFEILSDRAEMLWGREAAGRNTRIIASHERSLDGSRFAIALTSDRNIVFDQVNVAKGQTTILIYDRSGRNRIFALPLGVVEQLSFCISPNGSVLAVIIDDAIRLYNVPSTGHNLEHGSE